MSGGRRSRRSKPQVVNYAKEQEFSDGDLFEDSPSEDPTPRRGRPKGSSSRKSTGGGRGENNAAMMDNEEVDGGIYKPPKPIYTEKGYDSNLAPIRERFPFLPEFEPDGSPRIELLVGRRPIDEKEAGDNENGDDKGSDEEENNPEPSDNEDDEDSDTGGGLKKRRGRGAKKGADNKKDSPTKATKEIAGPIEYEYLVKYKGRSYLHLEWKTGADLESMNKSAKTLYRRYLKKLTVSQDDELESPEFDTSYAVPQKICAQAEQEITMELSDKELLAWEKQREKELALESDDDDAEAEGMANGDTPENKEEKKASMQEPEAKETESGEEKKEGDEDPEDWQDEDIDFSQLTIERLRKILVKDGPYYPVFKGCDNPYRDGYVTEPPKKPRASYLFFQCTMRSYFAKRNPNASQGELMTILGDQWKSMADAEQHPFAELAREEVKQYEQERARMEKAQKPNEMWQPIRRCLMVLDRIANDGFANIFLDPVSLDDFPDYDEAIDTPMDLGTVRKKLGTKKYQAPEQFARDVRKIWNNCKIYNRHGSAIWHVADYMSKQFERLYHAWVLDYRERYLRWAHPKARPWEHTCRQCDGKCGTPDGNLVLCDHCDAMYGYKCLTPPMKKLPTGVWHCPDCKPKIQSVRGARMLSAVAEQAARKRAELGDTPKRKVKQNMYLVKWAGLGYEFCTWETKADIGSPILVAAFHKLNNSFPDEPDMPEELVDKVLDAEKHINPENAGGKHCIPVLRTQLYAQTRAFQFTKFGMAIPDKVCKECGPKSTAGMVTPVKSGSSPPHPKEVVECLTEMTYRVSEKDSLQQLMTANQKLPPLMTGEYDAIVPITSKGLMMNVGEIHGSVAFLGYRTFPDGSKGPAEINKLIRNVGDKIIAVDGVSTVSKTFKEVIMLLRESGKNKFAFMRFLANKYAVCNSDLASVGNMGRYAIEELKKKFSADRKWLLVNRKTHVVEDAPPEEDKGEESDASAGAPDSDEESDCSEGDFQPDSDDEEISNKQKLAVPGQATQQQPPVPAAQKENGEKENKSATLVPPTSAGDTGVQKVDKLDDKEASEATLTVRLETTQSLAYRLLDIDIGYSSDEGGDEDCAYYVDGVDETFTGMDDISEEVVEATEAAEESKKEEKKKSSEEDLKPTLPVRRSDFTSLGDRAKMVASIALTSRPPETGRFDNFPLLSSKAIEEQKAKENPVEKIKDETSESPGKPVKRSTVKVEQIDTSTNETIHVWANVESAAATLQIPLNEMKQVLRGDYDEMLGDEVGGFRWRYAAAGAIVTAGNSDKKGNKKGKEAWLEFRDRLYDPNEPHLYKNQNRLRDYQVEGVNWLASTYYRKHGCILADEMGLGKTVQIVSYLEHLHRVEKILRPFLVVVPLSTVEHWRREFEGWTDMICCVYHDRQRVWRDVLREYEWYYEDRPHTAEYLKFDVLVTTYDTLIGDFDVISQIPFRAAVVDEAHRLRNQKGKLLECMKEISAKGTLQYGFQSRVLMSGTPLQNDLNELWTLLNFIEPFKFPDLESFMAQFGNMANKEQVEALQQKISPFMLRRVKEDVAKDIPAKEETVIDIELTSIQKQYYRAVFEHNHAFLNMGTSRATAPKLMNIQMELRKVCNHPCLLDGVEHREQDSQFKRYLEEGAFEGKAPEEQQHMLNEHVYIQTSGKMVLLDKLLPKLRQEGHKVLIFSQMVKMLDLISEYCDFRSFPYERLDGRVRGTDRQKSIDRFEREENSFLFLLSTRAGGVGINLTAADICIIFDSDWNPQNDVQAQARCHRIGQTKDVRIYRLITSRSFEQEMFDRASKKLGLEQAVLGTFDQENEDDKPTSKEMEQLLKKGAYALLDDDDAVTDAFCADDIESILAKRTRTRVVQGTKSASWLNKQGMVVSKSKFTSDSKTADLDVEDPLFWQKVMPDFVTAQIMLQKLHDLSDEIIGTTGKVKGRGRGRGRWKKKEEEVQLENTKNGEGSEENKDAPGNKESATTEDKNELAAEGEKAPEEKDNEEAADTVDKEENGSDDDADGEKKFLLTRTNQRKVAKFMSDLKAMMEGIFDEVDDDTLPSEDKQTCQKLLLTISVKDKLFNEEQRHIARAMLKRLEGNRRRRCRTSDQAQTQRFSPGRRSRQGGGVEEIREELRIVGKKKKRRKRGEAGEEPEKKRRRRASDDDSDPEGYKIHSDDEAEWSDVGEDIYQSGKKRPTISRKEARRRRQWAADDDAATAAGRAWPALPRDMVKNILGTLIDEVLKHDDAKGGVFSVPVPRDDFPEYYEQIKNPMDYGSMQKKLENGEYRSAQAMQKDFVFVMQNCLKFNAPDSEIVLEVRQQALMRPNLLRSAAMKHDLFLAEDGSMLDILDDDAKKKAKKDEDGTPKKRRRRKKGDEVESTPIPRKRGRKRKVDTEEAEIEVEEEEDDVPLASMKKKKPRIKISLADGEMGSEKKKRKKRGRPSLAEKQTEDDEADHEAVIEETPIPRKRRGRPPSETKRETPARKGRKKRGAKAPDPEAEDDRKADSGDDDSQSGAPETTKENNHLDADNETTPNAEDESGGENGSESAYLNVSVWKTEREALDDSFQSARSLFEKRGPWSLPSELNTSKFRDIALGTLHRMGKFDRYAVFAEGVSSEEAPGYYAIVTHPMDMATIKSKVEDDAYGEGSEAAAKLYKDFLLMFDNCNLYNDDDGEVIEEAARLFSLLPETYAAQCTNALKKQKKAVA